MDACPHSPPLTVRTPALWSLGGVVLAMNLDRKDEEAQKFTKEEEAAYQKGYEDGYSRGLLLMWFVVLVGAPVVYAVLRVLFGGN